MFLILRALFGIGMGGEWGVGASLAMEKAPPHRRGMLSGLLQEGYALGNLLAALCFFFVFPRWGWRPMFFIGGLPALLAFFVRSQVKESEVVAAEARASTGASYGRGDRRRTGSCFSISSFFMTMMSFVSHGTQDMYPTFLQRDWNHDPRTRAMITDGRRTWARSPAASPSATTPIASGAGARSSRRSFWRSSAFRCGHSRRHIPLLDRRARS